MTKVKTNPLLQEHADLPSIIEVDGKTIGECLDDIVRQYPQSKIWLFDQDSLMRVMISINNEEIVTLDEEGLNRKLESNDEIMIFAIVSGG